MVLTEQLQYIRDLYRYFARNPDRATRAEALDVLWDKYRYTPSRQTFIRQLRIIRELYDVDIVYDARRGVYVTQKLN